LGGAGVDNDNIINFFALKIRGVEKIEILFIKLIQTLRYGVNKPASDQAIIRKELFHHDKRTQAVKIHVGMAKSDVHCPDCRGILRFCLSPIPDLSVAL
jgi:hypothetical protein